MRSFCLIGDSNRNHVCVPVSGRAFRQREIRQSPILAVENHRGLPLIHLSGPVEDLVRGRAPTPAESDLRAAVDNIDRRSQPEGLRYGIGTVAASIDLRKATIAARSAGLARMSTPEVPALRCW